jgi:hypothetical protein
MRPAAASILWRQAQLESSMAINLVVSAMLATAAPAGVGPDAPTEADRAGKAYADSLAQQLRTSTSARERALSARMYFDDPAGGGKVLREAARAAPTDPLVQFLWATIGHTFNGCDAASPCPEQTMAWARVEPGNGLAWLPPFEALARAGDEQAIDEAIHRMAHAGGYDDHFVDAWLALRGAILARPMPAQVVKKLVEGGNLATDKEASDVMAMAYAAALPLPMVSLSRACRREAHPQAAATRFEDCARIGRGIVQSDSSVMMKQLGLSLVHASGLEGDADREANRQMDWLQQATVETMNRRGGAEGYFADLASTRSETRAQELLLARHGIALEPPADWQPRGR